MVKSVNCVVNFKATFQFEYPCHESYIVTKVRIASLNMLSVDETVLLAGKWEQTSMYN